MDRKIYHKNAAITVVLRKKETTLYFLSHKNVTGSCVLGLVKFSRRVISLLCALRSVRTNTGKGMCCAILPFIFMALQFSSVQWENRAGGATGRNANYCRHAMEYFGIASALP